MRYEIGLAIAMTFVSLASLGVVLFAMKGKPHA